MGKEYSRFRYIWILGLSLILSGVSFIVFEPFLSIFLNLLVATLVGLFCVLAMYLAVTNLARYERLRASEERYRALTELTTDVTVIIGSDFRSRYVSQSVFAVTGYHPHEIVGQFRQRFILPEDIPLLESALKLALQNPGQTQPVRVFRGRPKNSDEIRYYEGQFTNLLAEPSIVGIVMGVRDVTDREVAVQAARYAQQRYQALFERSHDAVFIIDLEGRVLDHNQRAANLLADLHQPLTGQSFHDLLRPGQSDDVRARLQRRESVPPFEVQFAVRDNSLLVGEVSASVVHDEEGQVFCYQYLVRDVTPCKRYERELGYLATHDSLTGLANRTLLEEQLEQVLEAGDVGQPGFVLVFIDVDQFKQVNDEYGHDAGDVYLKTLAGYLRQAVRLSDTVARVGGDEFVILMQGVKVEEAFAVIEEKIRALFPIPFAPSGEQVDVRVSIGFSCYPDDGNTIGVLLRQADLAMYRDKDSPD